MGGGTGHNWYFKVIREAARLRKQWGVTGIEVLADISDPEAVDRMFDLIEQQCSRLDVLVNNAVIQGCGFSFVDTPVELLQAVFSVNALGSFYCAQGAARMMLRQGCGAIVNIGSNTAEYAIRDRAAYITSKGPISSLTRAMAIDLGPKGI